MSSSQKNNNNNEIINQIIAYAKDKLDSHQFDLASKFIHLYYYNISSEDILERSIADLYGAAISHLKLIDHRTPKEVKVKIFNPVLSEDGFKSQHTIIQVVASDMPFLVDSIRMEVDRLGLNIHLMIHVGGVCVLRDKKNQVTDLLSYGTQDKKGHKKGCYEAPIAMEIDRQTDPKILSDIQVNIRRILRDVRAAVEDWDLMMDRLSKGIKNLNHDQLLANYPGEVKEASEFLQWLLNDHFIFLGFRAYEVVGEQEDRALRLEPNSSLGVLRDHTHSKMLREYSELPETAREIALSLKYFLSISKTNTMSTVHRAAYTDCVVLKCIDQEGQIKGEWWFIGLYTSDVYRADLKSIPMVREKVIKIIKHSEFPAKSHAIKDLKHILATLPRDDLIYGTANELFDWSMGIFHLQDRRTIRFFSRKDTYGRFMSCLVYVPSENFNTDLVAKMQKILMKEFNGLDVNSASYFSESVLARIHFVIRINPTQPLVYDEKEIEKKLIKVGVSWEDGFRASILQEFGEEQGNIIFNRYRYTFPASYREYFEPRQAVFDIIHCEKLCKTRRLEMSFYRPKEAPKNVIRFKLFRLNDTVPLSDALPMLENMGLRVIGEHPYQLQLPNGNTVWLNDFNMTYVKEPRFPVEEVKEIFQAAFYSIWSGAAENDILNRLVLDAKLKWREISVLRAYTKYFWQTGFVFSQKYMNDTLVGSPVIASLLVKLFKCYFDPAKVEKLQIEEIAKKIKDQILKALEDVMILDEDRILRRYLILIESTLRTNYFQLTEEGEEKKYLSFKLNPSNIPDIPKPLPWYEIFVYSPDFEGVHLRAAKVARGGIRWSDRKEDYRIEILGLMKAQQVKNAVIVPAGGKGGFVVKTLKPDASREKVLEQGINSYKNFIRGLLDVVDNLHQGNVVSRKNTVAYDGDDPYLVVAADKGTATFSDIANSISEKQNYWLGDAFASGGSQGYDHKKMGITARGAWVSALCHFQDLGINLPQTEITVVGIGDMSGDVFGNGLLLSKHIKLVAAFNHQHIFLDPDPSVQESYEERKRLFNLPRSSWYDYDRKYISSGGGVYSRSSKAIHISPEIKQLLNLKKDTVIPSELIQAILTAPVDLIWNGGVGTYVKGSQESHAEVGDRSNDTVRVNGQDLKARVVCEGGNLGLTQLGRVEYELYGGKINTDFIDNSTGVDCSDHEVNIKILFGSLVASHKMTMRKRNRLLMSMTDDVAGLVLKNSYYQNKIISRESFFSIINMGLHTRYLNFLEQKGYIDRKLEFLPDEKELIDRRSNDKGFTRPELCVLFAYSKILLKEEIKKIPLKTDDYLWRYVCFAFPKVLINQFEPEMYNHYLAKEIIATQLSNRLVSMMGIAFIYQMRDEMSTSIARILRCSIAAIEIFKLENLFLQIESLDHVVDVKVQHEMTKDAVRLVRRGIRWLLRNRRGFLDINETIHSFSDDITAIAKRLPKLLLGQDKVQMDEQQAKLIEQDVPESLASQIAANVPLFHAMNIIEVATIYHEAVFRVAKIYFTLSDRLDLFWFREQMNAYPVNSRWAVLARSTYKGDLDWLQRELTIRVLLDTKARSIPGKIKEWLNERSVAVERWRAVLADMRSVDDNKDFAVLFVAIRALRDLALGFSD